MKIKNSVHTVKPDSAIIIMCLAALAVCPLRIFQMTQNMDAQTGFFDNYESIGVIALYVVLAAAAALILLLTFLSADVPASIAPKGRHIITGAASLGFAATLFYDAIENYLPRTQSTATIVQNTQSLSVIHHVHAVFAMLSCCYFVVVALSYFSGKTFHKKLKLLSLSPLLWTIMRVLERITVIISIMRVSELFLELAALIFIMVFFLSFARISSDVNPKGSMWSLIATGCIGVLCMLTYTVPRIMLTAAGKTEFLVAGYPVYYCDIGCIVFAVVFIVTTLRCGYTREDAQLLAEESESGENADKSESEASGADENRGADGE